MKLFRSNAEARAELIEEDWGSLNWLAGKTLENCDGLTLGRVTIKKGHSNPKHSHPNCDEVLHLLRGKLNHVIGDRAFLMEPGDTTVAPAGVSHVAFSVGDEDAEMIVAYSSGERQFREEQ